MQAKPWKLAVENYDVTSGILTVNVYLSESGLTKLNFPAEGGKMKKSDKAMQLLFAYFYKIEKEVYDDRVFMKKHNIDEVLQAVKAFHEKTPPSLLINVQHENLKPSLREYQKLGVLWMLEKERYSKHTGKASEEKSGRTHPLYCEVTTLDGEVLYFNKYCGFVTEDRPPLVGSPPGGILGDEMGLGKTVEVLACMLCHPRTQLPPVQLMPVIDVCKSESKQRITSGTSDSSVNSQVEPQVLPYEASGAKSNDSSTTADIFSEAVLDRPAVESAYWNILEKKESFECICGTKREVICNGVERLRHGIVQCEKCSLFQHAGCVGYDLRDPFRGPFLCPHCHASSTPIPSGATLIVAPNSICHQWVDEILKHVKKEALNVLVYEGVHKQGYIQPQRLANQDVVITTYETLRKEVVYVDLPHSNSAEGRKLRKPKRYMATPSPMTSVEWWRICLDEAQMVECTTTKTAEMALRLSAVNRWCVTGTPIQKSIEDIYGLLLFLGIDPYWVLYWWNTLLYHPFCYGHKEPLIGVLGSVLWRTAKKDVINEICLPAQSEEVHSLTFSPVEEHFYRRQYQACERDAMQRLRKYTDNTVKLNDLDKHSLHQLLHPLTRLRQACCHPQAVRGEFIPIQKSMMTMEELLEQLIKKSKKECEEAHRQYVAATNGLASLHLLSGDVADAVEKYREVMRSVEEHKKQLRTDELQQLHAMHNLHKILRTKPPGVSPTLRDSELESTCEEICRRYKQKQENFVEQAHQVWIPLQQSIRELNAEFQSGRTWWADLVQYFVSMNYDSHLLAKVKEELSDNAAPGVDSIIRKFRDTRGLLFILSHHLDELQTAHNRLVSALRGLTDAPSDQAVVDVTVECCLRPSGRDLPDKCPFCKVHVLFEEYEGKLYCFTEKGVEAHFEEEFDALSVQTKRQGTWADSELEKSLKALMSFAKAWGGDRELLKYGAVHMKLLEAMKREFKAMRTVWIETKATVGSIDELDMATTTIRVREPHEPVFDPPQPNVIEQSQVEQMKLKFRSDQIIGKNDLSKKLGQSLYLKNLSTRQEVLENGENPEPCPICQRELGSGWSVLHCGHCYCMDCMRLMVARYSFGGANGSMKCAVCRHKTKHSDIAYVSTKPRENDNNEITIKGGHSTKVEGIVKCLLKIKESDPSAKSLVFSTWHDVLGVLAKALEENNISYKSLQSYKFQENLSSFKEDSDIRVLLLPVHSGANGLNLIEATHVLLVEPVLNPAQELQAIGRIHRIGQTRPTFVHRFLVRGTIEQKIHSLLQTTQAPSIINSHNSEETSFSIGDFKALFQEVSHTDIHEDDFAQETDPQEPDSNDGETFHVEEAADVNLGNHGDGEMLQEVGVGSVDSGAACSGNVDDVSSGSEAEALSHNHGTVTAGGVCVAVDQGAELLVDVTPDAVVTGGETQNEDI